MLKAIVNNILQQSKVAGKLLKLLYLPCFKKTVKKSHNDLQMAMLHFTEQTLPCMILCCFFLFLLRGHVQYRYSPIGIFRITVLYFILTKATRVKEGETTKKQRYKMLNKAKTKQNN